MAGLGKELTLVPFAIITDGLDIMTSIRKSRLPVSCSLPNLSLGPRSGEALCPFVVWGLAFVSHCSAVRVGVVAVARGWLRSSSGKAGT